MKIIKRQTKLLLNDDTETPWLNDSELKAFNRASVKAAIIQETVSYEDALKYLRLCGDK